CLNQTLNHNLNHRLIYNRQHFLRHRFSLWQKPSPKTGRWYHCFTHFLRHVHLVYHFLTPPSFFSSLSCFNFHINKPPLFFALAPLTNILTSSSKDLSSFFANL